MHMQPENNQQGYWQPNSTPQPPSPPQMPQQQPSVPSAPLQSPAPPPSNPTSLAPTNTATAIQQEVTLPDVSNPEGYEEQLPLSDSEPITWQASEYIHHEKQLLWFGGLALGAILLVVVAVFLVQSWSFAVLVVVMAIAAGYLGMKPPRAVNYHLSLEGVVIDNKQFTYHDFRGFGVVHDGALYSVVLLPNKRFMPAVRMYFPQELGEGIVDLLGSVLPMESVEQDFMDKLMRKLRF